MSSKAATSVSLALALILVSLTLSSAKTVYDVLADYNLPRGILPAGLDSPEDYDLDEDTGKLTVHLGHPCSVTRSLPYIFTQTVKLQPQVSATIGPYSLQDVKGITVSFTGLGPNLADVKVTSVVIDDSPVPWLNLIHFESRDDKIRSPSFPTFLFNDPPKCDKTGWFTAAAASKADAMINPFLYYQPLRLAN